jgi:hypothetical protein
VVKEEESLPPLEEDEAVSSPSFFVSSSLDDQSERNLVNDEDGETETLENSPCLEWWEEAERKAEEEDNEILEEQEALLESFATPRKEERTWAALAQPVRAEASLHGLGCLLACAHSIPSEDSPRLRGYGRPLQRGARPLRAKHQGPRKLKAPPLPSLSSSHRTTRTDVLY